MNRRSFVKKTAVGTLGATIAGMQLKASPFPGMLELMALSGNENRALILINLLGGNDGLNTIIPATSNEYGLYQSIRSAIAIPQNQLLVPPGLPNNATFGFHPAMDGFYNLFQQDKLAVVQNVSYPNINQSHFRSRDIWLSGSNSDEIWTSGWMGRYLSTVQWTSPDPIAIEVSSAASIALSDPIYTYHGFNVEDPEAFYNLVNGFPSNNSNGLPVGYMKDEILYILGVEQITNNYANQLHNRYVAGGTSQIAYPGAYTSPNGFVPAGYYNTNVLGKQLEIVAQLIRGGCETKVYICTLNGFDLHTNQVYSSGLQTHAGDGYHAALLYYLSSSVETFLSDLGSRTDDVLVATLSEFGRRAYQNSSKGTDHGDASPLFLAGNCIAGGVYNPNADLTPQTLNASYGNIHHTTDFREIFASLLIDWFGCPEQVVGDAITNGGVGWSWDSDLNGQPDIVENRLPLIEPGCVYVAPPPLGNPVLEKPDVVVYPNPTYGSVSIEFNLAEFDRIQAYLADMQGKYCGNLLFSEQVNGQTVFWIDVSRFAAGDYILRIETNLHAWSERIVKL